MALKIDRKIIILLILLFPLIYRFWPPYQRGFNCSDESLKHRFRTLWFKTRYLFISTLIIPLVIIYLIQRYTSPSSCSSSSNLKKFLFGFMINLNMTEIFKRIFGRLRPHVYDFCHLDRYCPNGTHIDHYIDKFECLNNDYPWYITNSRLSFYSGHSAMGAFAGTYLACFIHRNLFSQKQPQQQQQQSLTGVSNFLNNWKYRLSLLLLEMAIFIVYLIPGYSQYLIKWHFLSDILTGFTFGTLNALIVHALIQ
ncbi:putative phosphatidate phosphatase [Dermatophagoides farinae]|uniref:putative phosphatidate phosphatase n=1 Tax=Dermatophagoides farinae TaxID=6954 RepID=UPI003F640476